MKLLIYIIGFMIIFNFPIPVIFNSLTLSLAIILFMLLMSRWVQRRVLFYLHKKNILYLLVTSFVIVLLSIFIPFFYNTYDFTLVKGNLYIFGTISILLLFYPFIEKYIIKDKDPIIGIMNYILVLLVTQSIIQILAFIFPPILKIIVFFQKDIVVNTGQAYGNIRGLALTGNPFFALPSIYALSYIFIFFLILDRQINNKQFFYLLFFMIVGSIFSGRTAFIGLAIGLFYFFIERRSNFLSKVLKMLKLFFISFFFILITFNFLIPTETKELISEKVLPFAFEFVYVYLETGSLSTQSTDHLQTMYFPLSTETILFGDGRYTGDDGYYYMHTDAGYMRNILFYGISGLIFILFTQYFYFADLLKIKKNRLFSLTIFVLLLVIHYKGEVLAYLPMVMAPLFLLTLSATKYNNYIKTTNK